MGATETETVRLDLEGDFAKKALEDYEASVKLAAGLEALAQASAKVKAPAVWTAGDNLKFMEASAKFAVETAREAAEAHERAAQQAAAAWERTMQKLRNAGRAAAGFGDGVDAESLRRMNRIPTELQSSPQSIDWASALERESRKAGSAIRAAANDALVEAANIAKAEQAARRLSSVYDLVEKRARAAARAEAASDQEKFTRANRLPQSLQQAPPVFSGFQKLVGGIEKVFGPNAAGAFVKGASGAVEIGEKYGGAIKAAGGALAKGGTVVAGAALAIGAAAAALAYAGIKIASAAVHFGIEQTSLRERITNAIGAGGYQVAIKLAGQYGLDQEDAFRQVKGLLGAKFSEAEIPAIVRIAVGIGEVKGEEKARGFIEKLETQKNKGGKATEETVKGFAEVGVSADAVYKKLAQTLGITVAQAQAKVKAGMLDTAVVLKAVTAAAGDQFGGVADKAGRTVPALVGRLKLGFAQLFTGFDLGPLKGALENAVKVMEGSAGKKLFEAISHFGSVVIKTLFGPFEGPDGEAKLERFANGAARVINNLANDIERAGPTVEKLVWLLDKLFGAAPEGEAESGWSKAIKGIALAIGSFGFGDALNMARSLLLIADSIFGTDTAGMFERGVEIGYNFVAGIAEGLMSMSLDAIGALLGDQLVASVKASLGIASPSKEAIAIMGHFGDGLVKGAANDNGAAEAGATVAADVSGSTRDGLGAGGAGGGAAAGGGPVQIIVQVVAQPGQSPQELGDAVGEAAYQAWQRHARRAGREAQERAA